MSVIWFFAKIRGRLIFFADISPLRVARSAESKTSTSAPLTTCDASTLDGPELIAILTPLCEAEKPLAISAITEAADEGTETVKEMLRDPRSADKRPFPLALDSAAPPPTPQPANTAAVRTKTPIVWVRNLLLGIRVYLVAPGFSGFFQNLERCIDLDDTGIKGTRA